MEKTRLRKLIGLAMVVLGTIQTGTGIMQEDWIFAVLGFVYALLGVAYILFEGYELGQ